MRLLFTLGYQTMALPVTEGVNVAAVITALSQAKYYTSKGYGSEQRYVADESYEIEIKLVDDSKFTDGESPSGYFDKIEELTQKVSKADSERYTVQKQLADLQKKLKDAGITLETASAQTASNNETVF